MYELKPFAILGLNTCFMYFKTCEYQTSADIFKV